MYELRLGRGKKGKETETETFVQPGVLAADDGSARVGAAVSAPASEEALRGGTGGGFLAEAIAVGRGRERCGVGFGAKVSLRSVGYNG